jgi:WD40 repeat protein
MTPLNHHPTWVQALAFHADARRLFSTDYWGNIACWNHTDEAPRIAWSRADAHSGWIRAALVSQDGQYLITAGNDLALRLWDVDTGRPIRELAGHGSHVYALAQHAEGGLVSGDQEGNIKHWNLATGRCERTLDGSELWHSPEATMSLTGIGGVRSLAFSLDGRTLYCGGMGDATSAGFAVGKPNVVVFDWARGSKRGNLRFREEYEGFVTGLIAHPDGFLIGAVGGKGGAIGFWRPDAEEPFHTVRQLRHIRELALHPDNLRLVAAAFQQRGQGGNGGAIIRADEYNENVGTVRVHTMSERPAPVRPR